MSFDGKPLDGASNSRIRNPAVPQTRRPGGQQGNTNRATHGLTTLSRRLKGAGLTRNDGRSALERVKRDWKADIRAARGGELSPQQEALLEVAANTWLMLSTADDFILERGVVNRRKGTLRPIVEQRAKLARTLRELLDDIGLDRVPAPRPTLAEWQREFAERRAAAAQDDDADPDVSVLPIVDPTLPAAQDDHVLEPWGPPALDRGGRSTSHKFRHDSGNGADAEHATEEENLR